MDDRDTLERLRAADPAPDVDTRWADSPARALAQQRLADEVTDVVSIGGPQARPRRSILWPSVAAAAVLAAAVGLAAIEVHDGATTPSAEGSTSAPTQPATSEAPTSTTPVPVPDPEAETEALIARLLDSVPVVPDATQVDSSPSPLLDHPQTSTGSPNELTVHRWWTVPGTLLDASAYLGTHRPHQYSDGGTMSSDGPDEHVVGLSWEADGTDYATFTEIQIALTQIGDRVGIRADAQAIWFPPRDPAMVLGDVTSVDVIITRYNDGNDGPIPGAPTVRRTLTGEDAQALADIVDGQPPLVVAMQHCPMQIGHFVDEFRFLTASGHTVDVTANVTGCDNATISVPGHEDVPFNGLELGVRALQLLGLPNEYGYH